MIKLFDFLAYHGFFTAVLSNGGSAHQWDKVRALGLKRWVPKQNIIISGDAGYMKPDIRIFRYAEEHLNLTPAQIWFTGDSIKNDVYGSEAAGWHTIFFNRRKKAIPEDVHPDLIVENEYTLSEQIRRIAIIPSDMK